MEIDKHYSIIDRIKLCWAILTNKEFYACVVVGRYDDESTLGRTGLCYGRDTINYKERVKEAIKQAIEMDHVYNQSHKGV